MYTYLSQHGGGEKRTPEHILCYKKNAEKIDSLQKIKKYLYIFLGDGGMVLLLRLIANRKCKKM